MIRYINNVVTGNFAHWNTHHNALINDLWKKADSLNAIEKIMAQQVILSSMTISEDYLGPYRKQFTLNKLTDMQVKSLDYADFQNVHKELIKVILTLLTIRKDTLTTYCTLIFSKLFKESLKIIDDLDNVDKDRIKEILFTGANAFANASKIMADPVLTFSFFNSMVPQIELLEQRILFEIFKK